MSSTNLFTSKINLKHPFHVYNSKKFSQKPFLILHPDDPQQNLPLPSSDLNSKENKPSENIPLIKPNNLLPEAKLLQKVTLQMALMKQQNLNNKYFLNYNLSNIPNPSSEQNYPFNPYQTSFYYPEREKILTNLSIPETVLRKMYSNTTKFFEKTHKNYKNISKSPDFRKNYERKDLRKLSFNERDKSFMEGEEEKENKPIFDLKHLPSPNSRTIINYDELKIYNEEDECLELDEEKSMKSFVSKEF